MDEFKEELEGIFKEVTSAIEDGAEEALIGADAVYTYSFLCLARVLQDWSINVKELLIEENIIEKDTEALYAPPIMIYGTSSETD